jgi:NAD(P)H-flavin reductase
MTLASADDAGLSIEAEVREVARLSGSVARLRLAPRGSFSYRAGQFVTLSRADGLTRSYSLASLPREDFLELHVREVPQGRMSAWLCREVRPGDVLSLRGPAGECFYTAENQEQPLVLAGTGTGLAPLYGIVRDAVSQGHTGPIELLHGARDEHGLYYEEELRALAAQHTNLRYTRCILQGEAREGVEVGELPTLVKAHVKNAKGWRAYLCGDPSLVKSLKRALFLGGASLQEIFADPFVEAPPPA